MDRNNIRNGDEKFFRYSLPRHYYGFHRVRPIEDDHGGAFGGGFYFSNNYGLGRQYSGGNDPIVARVVIENPFVIDLDLPYEDRLARKRVFRRSGGRERLIADGYDGVLVKQGSYLEVIAYYPEQIEILGRGRA